ncbi:hypothetical protein ACFLTH_04320 [Bacteroidota bacterium]
MDISNFMHIIPALAIAIFFVSIIFIVLYLEKKRTKELESESVKIGFSFTPKADSSFISKIKVFNNFQKGYSHKAKNIMRGRRSSIGLTICDYRYTVGGGKSSHTYNQTVVIADIGQMITGFNMTKKSIFYKIGEKFGMKDIDFDNDPEFSKKFLLKGIDEPAVRKLFSSSVRNFFDSQNLKYNVEAEGHELVVFTPGKRIKPELMNEHINQTLAVVRLFQKELEKGL